MELEEKIQRIIENAKYCGLHSHHATQQILLLVNSVGLGEQLPIEKCNSCGSEKVELIHRCKCGIEWGV